MTTARQLWHRYQVPNGRVQFLATVLVLQHMAQYSRWHAHQQRVLAILKARQY